MSEESRIPENVETYAQLAFAAVMAKKKIDVIPENVNVARGPQGVLVCTVEDPERRVNPFARGIFVGNHREGKLRITELFVSGYDAWQSFGWHHFSGTIPLSPK